MNVPVYGKQKNSTMQLLRQIWGSPLECGDAGFVAEEITVSVWEIPAHVDILHALAGCAVRREGAMGGGFGVL